MQFRWGLGPVFLYEWRMLSRRWQTYGLRSLFVAILGAGMMLLWRVKFQSQPLTIKTSALMGEYFFYALIGGQLAFVLVLAPAYTAGAVCLDKARGSLMHLLATDLSDTEIIFGKLAARLLPILGLILCSMPMLFGAILMGGIMPEAAIGAYLISLGVAVLGCSLALALSVWGRKTYEVLLAVYAIFAVVILAGPVWSFLTRWWGIAPPSWVELANPFRLAFLPYISAGASVLEEQATFLGVTAALSTVLAVVAARRVRAVTLRQASLLATGEKRAAFRARPRIAWLPGASLDGNPVLWREWHRRRGSVWLRIVWWLYAWVAGIFSAIAVGSCLGAGGGARALLPWVNGLQVAVGLLFLSVASVTAMSEERVRGSLDVLLATPLSAHAILWGKWWGTYRIVPRLAILPCLTSVAIVSRSVSTPGGFWLGPVSTPGGFWLGPLLMAGIVLICGAAITSLGLFVGMWVARPGRALTWCAFLYLVATVVPFLWALIGMGGRSDAAEFLAMASPFFDAGNLTDALQWQGVSGNRFLKCVASSVFWQLAYLGVAIGFYVLALLTFDRRLGRTGSILSGRGFRGCVKPPLVKKPRS